MRYQINNAIVKYGADTIIESVNFEIHDKEKIAVVGRNGCGKTTLLKLIAGEITMSNPDSDETCGIFMAGKQTIGYLHQISFPDGSVTVEDEIKKVFAPVFECEKRMQELEHDMKSLVDTDENKKQIFGEYNALQKTMDALNGYTWKQDMEMMVQKFGFPIDILNTPVGLLSGGQQTKIAFIKLLLTRPDIMLLDEPTNHLDMDTIEWLESYIKNYDRAVVIVSHDRMFLDNTIDVTYEIEYHRMKRYPGNYSAFLRQKEEARAKQEKDYEAQQKEIKRLSEWIEKWKNTPTKVSSARSKQKMIEHMVLIEKPRRFDLKAFQGDFMPEYESYNDVIIAKKLQIGYDHVLSTVDFELHKGERLAIIGPNGTGKSTLLKTVTDQIPGLGGQFKVGTNVKWGYFDQQEAVKGISNPKQTVIDNFWDEYPGLKEVEVRSALGNFLFSQDDVYKEMGQLSGGEKVRLSLCKMLKKRPNLLILDEPTNHMDIVGKQALEEMLKNYSGTVLFVSHDRFFIRETATDILEIGKDTSRYYPYGYDEYLSARNGQVTANAPLSKAKEVKKESEPTLSDVFDKKNYYNPGKVLSRLKQQKKKYETLLEESEKKLNELTIRQSDPKLACNYEELTKISQEMEAEEHNQETLLERLLETETELMELEAQE